MATVYEGTEVPTERHVAIKFLRSDLAKNPDMVSMFQAEGAIVTKLDHPNLIRGLASGIHGGSHYIVMEFVSGPTLRERLKWGQPERDEALSILRQAAAGLDHAHDRGVVHRDIKPDNFILEKSVVRLGDFGIAQVEKRDQDSKDSSALGGTVIYSAPEQFKEFVTIDRRADVYSLGIVAYEMFTGRTPFTGYKPASTISHRVPRAADAVLEKAFNDDPDERYPTAGAFVTALEAALTGSGLDSTQEPLLDLETPSVPMKAVSRTPVPGALPESGPGTPRPQPVEEPGSPLVPWIVLAIAVVVVGLLAAKMLGLGPFGKSTGAAPQGTRNVRASIPREPLDATPPCVLGRFARPEADPPAPAQLLEDRVAVALSKDIDGSGIQVLRVTMESRATRTCDNNWHGTVHEFVRDEAVGGLLVFDANHAAPLPRVSATRIEFAGHTPARVHVELQNPDAVLDLDLAGGKGTLQRLPGTSQDGACEFRPAR